MPGKTPTQVRNDLNAKCCGESSGGQPQCRTNWKSDLMMASLGVGGRLTRYLSHYPPCIMCSVCSTSNETLAGFYERYPAKVVVDTVNA